jgi:hypothetical protein
MPKADAKTLATREFVSLQIDDDEDDDKDDDDNGNNHNDVKLKNAISMKLK